MREPAPWHKRYGRMLMMACLLGLFSQYLFIGKEAGVSVVLFLLGFYFIFGYAARGRLGGFDKWRGQSTAGWLLVVPITLLAMTYTLYGNELFRALNALALPLLITAQTMFLTRSDSHEWHKHSFAKDVLRQSIAIPLRCLPAPFSMIRSIVPGANEEQEDSSYNRLRKIMAGLLLASPILIVVTALLASADRIFQSWLHALPSIMEGISFGEWIARAVLAMIVMLYIFCYIWGLLFPKSEEKKDIIDELWGGGIKEEQHKLSLDPIVAGTLIISVNIVYVLFAAIQFSYLFGAANGLLPEGAAYAEYARKGFVELVLVAVINLGLLLPSLHIVRRTSDTAELVRKLLLSMLVGCTIVMLISAYSRLSLYEAAYGFTQSRLLVHGFMLFLGVLLIIALVRIWREHISLSKSYICTAIIAYVLMNYVNLDYRIAHNNIARYERTGVIDLKYLGMLSTDAAPALLRLQAKHPELESVDEAVNRMKEKALRANTWPSWNLSKQRAK